MSELIQYVFPSLIGAGAMIVVQLIVSARQGKISDIRNEYIIKEIKNDIKRLETKQDKHNGVMDRMIIVERDLKACWKQVDNLAQSLGHEHDK